MESEKRFSVTLIFWTPTQSFQFVEEFAVTKVITTFESQISFQIVIQKNDCYAKKGNFIRHSDLAKSKKRLIKNLQDVKTDQPNVL